MNIWICYFIVWAIVALICVLSGITQKGARQEIALRGMAGVGMATIRVADGTATMKEKIGIAIFTIAGTLISPMHIIVSIVGGGILFVVIGWLS